LEHIVASVFPHPRLDEKEAEQVVAHQPAISISISTRFPFNRAGGRTSNVRQKIHE
jgi:hypothetical protein